MAQSKFDSYLRKALGGVTQVKAGEQIGLSQSVLNRLLCGEKAPNYEHAVKLAVYLNVHPAELLEMAGKKRDAEVFRRLMPEGGGAGPLVQRVSALARRGEARRVDRALAQIEALWDANRVSFEALARQMGCQAACLVADHLAEGDVLYRWNCPPEQAALLAERRKAPGWRRFRYQSPGMGLDLFLSGGKLERLRIDTCLQSWASVFSSLLSPGQAGDPAEGAEEKPRRRRARTGPPALQPESK